MIVPSDGIEVYESSIKTVNYEDKIFYHWINWDVYLQHVNGAVELA
jgi:hypothetical protein